MKACAPKPARFVRFHQLWQHLDIVYYFLAQTELTGSRSEVSFRANVVQCSVC